MSEPISEYAFTRTTTHAARKLHWRLVGRAWATATLCGHPALDERLVDCRTNAPECLQCSKSRDRMLEGRPH